MSAARRGARAGGRRAAATRARPARRTAVAKRAPAKRTPAKRTAAKRPPARRPAATRAAAKRRAAPAVRRAAPRSPRPAVLAGLRAGRDAVVAAARRLGADAALAPRAPGSWSPREIVLHLAAWDDWILEALPAARRNVPPPAMGAAAVNAFNARAVAAGGRLDWPQAVRRFRDRRAAVLAALARVPASPSHVWSRGHAVGRLIDFVPEHDRHHADQLAAAAAPRAFAAQRREADARGLVLFELQRARVAVLAAIQGLSAGGADRPTAPGKWSPREIVLHLAVRDQVRLDEFDAILGGSAPSWAALPEADMAAANERHLEPLRARSWDEAVRLLQGTRQRLLERVLAVPAEPEAVWTTAHPFGAMLRALPGHDRHHAEQVRNARLAG